jgi:hypothetical protein
MDLLLCGPFVRTILVVDAVAIGWRCQSAKAAQAASSCESRAGGVSMKKHGAE